MLSKFKLLSPFFCFLIFSIPLLAQEKTQEDYKAFVANQYINLYLTYSQQFSLFGLVNKNKEYNQAAAEKLKSISIESSNKHLATDSRYFNSEMLDAIKEGRRNIGISKDILVIAYPLVYSNIYTAAAASLATVAAGKGLESFYDYLEKKYTDKISIAKNGFFQNPQNLTKEQMISFRETDFSKVDLKDWLYKNKVSDSYTAILLNLNTDERVSYLKLMQKQANKLNINTLGWSNTFETKTLSNISATENIKLLLGFEKSQESIIEKTGDIEKSINVINTQLNDLEIKTEGIEGITKNNAADIEYLKLTLYSNLPSEEKMNWVKANFLNLPEDEKHLEELKLKDDIIHKERIKLATSVTNYFAIADASLNFLKAAGIKDPAMQTIADGVNYALKGMQIAGNIMSGNYVAAISGLTDMVFGGGPTPEQQIMGMLDDQKKMLDQIIENQQKTFQILENIDKKLDAMVKMQQGYFDKILGDINNLSWGMKTSIELQQAIVGKSIDQAKVFLDINNYESFSEKEAYWKSLPGLFNTINTEFETLLQKDHVHTYFKLAYTVSDKDQYVSFRNKSFIPLLQEYLKRFPKLNSGGNFTAFLSANTSDFKSLTQKNKIASDTKLNVQSFTPNDILDILDPKTIIEFADLIIQFGRIRIFAKEPDFSSMKTPFEVVEDKNKNEVIGWNNMTKNDLKKILKLIDISIAQQQLLSGDILIPSFATSLDDSITRVLMVSNSQLLSNVGNFYIKSLCINNKIKTLGYRYAYALQDTQLLRTMFSDNRGNFPYKFNLQKVKVGDKDSTIVYIKLDNNVEIQLPTPLQFDDPYLIPQPMLSGLISVKERVLQELLQLDFKKQLTSEELNAANLFMLLPPKEKNK